MRATIIIALSSLLLTASEPPPTGWTTRAKVVRVVDGDTIDVEITRRVRVRLEGCWAAEKYSPKGPAATQNMELLTRGGNGTKCILHIPTDSEDIKDVFTFGRVVGRVWMEGDPISINTQQVLDGYATKGKQ